MSGKAPRRSFLTKSALLGVAYYVGSSKFSNSCAPSVIVVGAGYLEVGRRSISLERCTGYIGGRVGTRKFPC
jgi:hypothetical protein